MDIENIEGELKRIQQIETLKLNQFKDNIDNIINKAKLVISNYFVEIQCKMKEIINSFISPYLRYSVTDGNLTNIQQFIDNYQQQDQQASQIIIGILEKLDVLVKYSESFHQLTFKVNRIENLFNDSIQIQGYCEFGIPHGHWYYNLDSFKFLAGEYKFGKKYGQWKELIHVSKDTQLIIYEQGIYNNNIKVGEWTTIDLIANQILSFGHYDEYGNKQGKWLEMKIKSFEDFKVSQWEQIYIDNIPQNQKLLSSIIHKQQLLNSKICCQIPMVTGHVFIQDQSKKGKQLRYLILQSDTLQIRNDEILNKNSLEVIPLITIQKIELEKQKIQIKMQLLNGTYKNFYCRSIRAAKHWLNYLNQALLFIQWNFECQKSSIDVKENNYYQKSGSLVFIEDIIVESQTYQYLKEQFQDEKLLTLQQFVIKKSLGAGLFGKVYLAQHQNGQQYALKQISKKFIIQKKLQKYAQTEMEILKNNQCPFIIKSYAILENDQAYYIILEYCPGRDLVHNLILHGKFTEEQTRFYIAELILAIEYLHQKDILYRDLKPDNILLDKRGHIKLIDFGLSKIGIKQNNRANSYCGTVYYMSPEMINKNGASRATDIYGIGTVFYELLTGKSPFFDKDENIMEQKIKDGILKWPNFVSQIAKNLILKMLDRDEKQRIQLSEIKNDQFFNGIDWQRMEKQQYAPPIIEFEDISDCE